MSSKGVCSFVIEHLCFHDRSDREFDDLEFNLNIPQARIILSSCADASSVVSSPHEPLATHGTNGHATHKQCTPSCSPD